MDTGENFLLWKDTQLRWVRGNFPPSIYIYEFISMLEEEETYNKITNEKCPEYTDIQSVLLVSKKI